MRENCTYSLSGGRWPARKRATSDPTAMRVMGMERRAEGPKTELEKGLKKDGARSGPNQEGINNGRQLASDGREER